MEGEGEGGFLGEVGGAIELQVGSRYLSHGHPQGIDWDLG